METVNDFFSEFDQVPLYKVDEAINYLEKLKHRPVMSRSIAAEADSIFPVFKIRGESSFTETLSNANFSFITENMGTGAWAVVAAAVAAIGYGIFKFFKWITKKEGDFSKDTIKKDIKPGDIPALQKVATERMRYNIEKLHDAKEIEDYLNQLIIRIDKPIDIVEGTFHDSRIFKNLPRKYKGKNIKCTEEFLNELAFAMYKENNSTMAWRMLFGDIYNLPALWLIMEGTSEISRMLSDMRKVSAHFNQTFERIKEVAEDKVFHATNSTYTEEDFSRLKNLIARIDDDLFASKDDVKKPTELNTAMNNVADILSKKDRQKSNIIKRLLGGSKYKEIKYPMTRVLRTLSSSEVTNLYREVTGVVVTDENSIYSSVATATRMYEELNDLVHSIIKRNKEGDGNDKAKNNEVLSKLKGLLGTVRNVLSKQMDFYNMVESLRKDIEALVKAALQLTVNVSNTIITAGRFSEELKYKEKEK